MTRLQKAAKVIRHVEWDDGGIEGFSFDGETAELRFVDYREWIIDIRFLGVVGIRWIHWPAPDHPALTGESPLIGQCIERLRRDQCDPERYSGFEFVQFSIGKPDSPCLIVFQDVEILVEEPERE